MELSKNQIDEFSTHIQHEFWSIKEGREVLSPDEVRTPKPIAEAPFTLRTIQNREYILRSSLASDGDDSKAELALRNEKMWEGQVISESGQSSIIIQGEVLEVGTGASQVVHSSPRNTVPLSGQFAHSGISLQLAIGAESYLAGWDRTATGDWHSILRLTADQAKAAKTLLQKFSESPNGLDIRKSNWAKLETESFATEMRWKSSDSQSQDLGVIHLDEDARFIRRSPIPQTGMIPPKDNLARKCEFKWISAPPVPSDQHRKMDYMLNGISARE